MIIPLELLRQPTESTCGPTCLHAIYRFHETHYPLKTLIDEVPTDESGGTVSVHLALHALSHGFHATTYSYNLRIFDPTWQKLGTEELISKLEHRTGFLASEKLVETHEAYIQFLRLGGRLKFDDLTPALLRHLITQGSPVLTGLSATYLYQTMRERSDCTDDDLSGFPVGHFLIANGYDEQDEEVIVSDPYRGNPFHPSGNYRVSVHRFINSVMLGIVTYDANLLIISPK